MGSIPLVVLADTEVGHSRAQDFYTTLRKRLADFLSNLIYRDVAFLYFVFLSTAPTLKICFFNFLYNPALWENIFVLVTATNGRHHILVNEYVSVFQWSKGIFWILVILMCYFNCMLAV